MKEDKYGVEINQFMWLQNRQNKFMARETTIVFWIDEAIALTQEGTFRIMEMFSILIWVVVPYKSSSYYMHLKSFFLTMYELYHNNPQHESKKKLSNKWE